MAKYFVTRIANETPAAYRSRVNNVVDEINEKYEVIDTTPLALGMLFTGPNLWAYVNTKG